MSSREFAVLLALTCLLSLLAPVSATYAGDHPLTTAYHDELRGDTVFTTGNSTYSGSIKAGGRYAVSFDIDLPDNATVSYQRLYVYWSWSKLGQAAIYPQISVNRSDTGPLSRVGRYVDSKGFVSSNDFFSGTDVFETGGLKAGTNNFTVVLENAADDNRTFVVQGIGVLAVYEDQSLPEAIIWVKEGADLLYNNYGITPAMATSRIDFNGTIDRSELSSAEMLLVAPSGGYTRENIPEINHLFFNREGESSMPSFFEAIISAVFPGSNGKEWVNVFDSDETRQVGIDRRDVLPYLRSENNFAAVQDNKDYLVLSNAVLQVVKKE